VFQDIAQDHDIERLGDPSLDAGALHVPDNDLITRRSRLFSSDWVPLHAHHAAPSCHKVLAEESVGAPDIQS
jgi:hypothetical protein